MLLRTPLLHISPNSQTKIKHFWIIHMLHLPQSKNSNKVFSKTPTSHAYGPVHTCKITFISITITPCLLTGQHLHQNCVNLLSITSLLLDKTIHYTIPDSSIKPIHMQDQSFLIAIHMLIKPYSISFLFKLYQYDNSLLQFSYSIG